MKEDEESRVIKPASHDDIKSMMEICEENLLEDKCLKLNSEEISENGFLLYRLTFEKAKEIIDNKNFFCLILKNNDETLGYLFGCDLEKTEDGFYEKALKLDKVKEITGKIYYHRQIAKKAGFKHVGRQLLTAMVEEAKNHGYSHIICKIVLKPFYNQTSVFLHEKFGFRKIAEINENSITTGVYLKEL